MAGPAAFCRLNADATKLQVVVYNQGAIDPSATQTTTRVTFTTGATSVQVPDPDSPNTPASPSGGSQLVEFAIPTGCTSTVAGGYCDFTIGVDVGNTVAESSETNNTVTGTCFPFLF